MIKRPFPALLLAFLPIAAWCGTPVIFIGLSGKSAPGIEKNLSMLIEERLSTIGDVFLIMNDESKNLQSHINQYSYPAITAPLIKALKRFAPDSALIVWGRVRECSIKPARHYFFNAQIHALLNIELTMFNMGTHSYAFIGDAKANLKRDKGFIFWFGSIEDAVQISASERSELLESLQVEGAKSTAGVLQTLLLYSRSKNRTKELPTGISAKKVTIEPSPADDTTAVSGADPSTDPSAAQQEDESGEAPVEADTGSME
jgi:hypothetical protein